MKKQIFSIVYRIESFTLFVALINLAIFSSLNAQVCSPNYTNQWQWGPHSTWFFGDGVFMNFPNGSGAPTFSYKVVSGDNHRAYEGSAVINDNVGNLLAYSNGRSLWRANGALLANNLLAGNEGGVVGQRNSAAQGTIAVRHPMNPDKIYIFTTDDALNNTDLGLNYSILDLQTMIATAPVRLKDDQGNNFRTTEQIDATFHTNGYDVWICVRESGNANQANFRNFYAYQLTCAGLNATPVKSIAGPPIKGVWAQNWERGSLKFSWNGKQMIAANHINDWSSFDEAISVYDFDNGSGIVSNGKAVAGEWNGVIWQGTTYESMYDVEWAPDNKGAYIVPANGIARLLWLDASLPTANAIYKSIKVVTTNVTVPGDLKLGGDGKLYQSTFSNNLKVFSFATAADLNTGSNVSVANLPIGSNSNYGLANMFLPPVDYLQIQDPGAMDCSYAPVDLNVEWVCKGSTAEDTINNPNGWQSDCGACITDHKKGIFDPTISGPGTFNIYYSYGNLCTITDTFTLVVGICTCRDTALANVIPDVCSSNQNFDLNNYKITTDAGTWTIVSQPLGGTANVGSGHILNINNTIAGTYTVQFTVANQWWKCGNNAQRSFQVFLVPVSLSLNPDSVCINSNPITLSGGSPLGGTYSGIGIGTSPTFDPANAGGTGYKIISYNYVDNNGCHNNAVDSIRVDDFTPVNFALLKDEVCINESAFSLDGALPLGGIYSGTGVTTSPTFDPTVAGVGDHIITYTYTNTHACVSNNTDTVTVHDTSVVSFNLIDDNACIDELPFILSGGSPLGGNYSGTGIGTSPTFDPANSGGAGKKIITYTYSNNFGCTTSSTDSLIVYALPVVSLNLGDTSACINENPFSLTGGAPTGGIYSGTGLTTSPTFDPSVAGLGDKIITYTYTDVHSCVNFANDTIAVHDTSVVTLQLVDDNACIDEAPFALSGGSPVGGNYSGTGIVGSPTFNPANAGGSGKKIITYTYNNSYGCITSSTDEFTVNDLPIVTLLLNDTAVCIDVPNLTLAGGNPIGGTYSGNGINVSPVITPSLAGGAGSKWITYTFTDNNGCVNSAGDSIHIIALPTVSLADTSVCPGGMIALKTTPSNWTSYLWSSGSTKDTIHYNKPNTVVSVTVGDKYGCKSSVSANIKLADTLKVELVANPICLGENVTLNAAQYGPFQAPVIYDWDDILTPNEPASRDISTAGLYGVRVMDGRGCFGSDSVNVIVNPLPKVSLGKDTAVCFTGKEFYAAKIPNIYSKILWSDNTTDTLTTVYSITNLSVIVENQFGCKDTDDVQINEHCDPTIVCVPNVVTPNGDGLNDELKICDDWYKYIPDGDDYMKNILEINFMVFDRWGIKMYECNNLFPNWDLKFNGNTVAAGTYYWVLTYTDSSHKSYEHSGWTLVIE